MRASVTASDSASSRPAGATGSPASARTPTSVPNAAAARATAERASGSAGAAARIPSALPSAPCRSPLSERVLAAARAIVRLKAEISAEAEPTRAIAAAAAAASTPGSAR